MMTARSGWRSPSLQGLARAHPLREQLHALLMLALYRCGRQGEALAAYRHARRILVGDLGIEPGADLQALHQQILTADPAVAAPRAEGHRACDARGGRRRRAWPSLPQLTARRVSARRCTYRRRRSE